MAMRKEAGSDALSGSSMIDARRFAPRPVAPAAKAPLAAPRHMCVSERPVARCVAATMSPRRDRPREAGNLAAKQLFCACCSMPAHFRQRSHAQAWRTSSSPRAASAAAVAGHRCPSPFTSTVQDCACSTTWLTEQDASSVRSTLVIHASSALRL